MGPMTSAVPEPEERAGNVMLLVRMNGKLLPASSLVRFACLLLDQIKREKGVWWMPWQQEAMKDVILCDKLGGAENRL
jgi:hypothetical protein